MVAEKEKNSAVKSTRAKDYYYQIKKLYLPSRSFLVKAANWSKNNIGRSKDGYTEILKDYYVNI